MVLIYYIALTDSLSSGLKSTRSSMAPIQMKKNTYGKNKRSSNNAPVSAFASIPSVSLSASVIKRLFFAPHVSQIPKSF